MSPYSNPLRIHQELRAANACHTPTSPGTSSPASHRTTASSTTVTSTATPRSPPAKTTIVSATSTRAATSHRTPLVWMWRGSGGGSPVGRRRRARRTVPGGIRWATARADGSTGRSMAPPNPRRPGVRRRRPSPYDPPSRLRGAPITVQGRRPPQKPAAASIRTRPCCPNTPMPAWRELPSCGVPGSVLGRMGRCLGRAPRGTPRTST
jgi:hypothetical protein